MKPHDLQSCLAYLGAAEMILDEAGELTWLAHLSLVIDMLRRAHGLTDRAIDELNLSALERGGC